MGGYGGHAGAFGTARNVMAVVRSHLSGFFTNEILRKFWTPYSGLKSCSRTLGWDTPTMPGSSTGYAFSKKSVGHLGFTGTSLWLDLERGVWVTLLTNRVHPTRENEKIREFRPKFHETIMAEVKETYGF